ncbi:MAG: glycosyltransferase family 4 protein [Bacteroidaceae bacterium]|nr:glycosyltransferase family 4 protein [Bacteroidaceae bacterium]
MGKDTKRIIFLLPGCDIDAKTRKCVPVGGYKVVYEYANMLARDGFDVVLAFSHARCKYANLLRHIYGFAGYLYRKFTGQMHAGEWFNLESSIKKWFPYCYRRPFLSLRDTDLVFATAYDTAVELNNMTKVPQSNKYYLIQGYEIWRDKPEAVKASYRFGFHNITIAPWLQDIVKESEAEATLITNGLDFNRFSLDNPIEDRSPFEVVLMNHTLEQKRVQDSRAALDIVKKQIPELHVSMFGTCEAPSDMPSWYTYYHQPTGKELCDIYNHGAIYVAASDFEGFGLTIGEAMICGCAVACTDNGGFRCMAEHEKTAFLSPVYDVEALAKNIVRLITDNELRHEIAHKGNHNIQQFTWEKSYQKLKTLLPI